MSNRVSSELFLLSENLRLNASSGRVAGMEPLHQWLATVEHKVTPLLPSSGPGDSRQKGGEISSPFDASLKMEVFCGSDSDRETLRDAWYGSRSVLPSISGFLDRWAATIERHADLVALVMSTFVGTCFREVREVEVGRAVSQLRYFATRCPYDVEVSGGSPFVDTAHIRLGECMDLGRLCYLVGMALTDGKHPARNVIVSPLPESSTAPLVHLLTQLAHLDCPGLAPIASVPLAGSESSWGGSVVGIATTVDTCNATRSLWCLPRTSGRSCSVIMESADLFSAVESAIAGARLWCWGRKEESAHLILAQESVVASVISLLKERLNRCQLASSPDHTGADVAPYSSVEASKALNEAMAAAKDDGVVVEDVGGAKLVLGEQLSGPVASRDLTPGLDGPYVYVVPFRTATEAVKLANHCPRRCRVSLWTETPGQVNEMATKLKYRQVAINCSTPFDARIVGKTEEGHWTWVGGRIMGGPPSTDENSVSNGTVLKKAGSGGGTGAAAGWASCEAGERRRKLGIVVEKMERGSTKRKIVENLLISAEDMVAGKEWPVNSKCFRGHVTVHEEPVGQVSILVDHPTVGADDICVLVSHVILLGNTATVVTGSSIAKQLRERGMDHVQAVKIKEGGPGVMIQEAKAVGSVLYALDEAGERRLVHACLGGGPRMLSVENWMFNGCRMEDELIRHFCTLPKVVWTPAFDAFAN